MKEHHSDRSARRPSDRAKECKWSSSLPVVVQRALSALVDLGMNGNQILEAMSLATDIQDRQLPVVQMLKIEETLIENGLL